MRFNACSVRLEYKTAMQQQILERTYEVIVVGGGLAGISAAIASARHGAKTAIVQNRPMFGGNASSEIRMHVVGASCHMTKKNVNETGIIEELLLENKWRNPRHSFSVWDSVLWEKVHFQKNLDAYLNTTMSDVEVEDGTIRAIRCYQMTTEKRFRLAARIFVDATGHGTLGKEAGAAFRYGSEARSEFQEKDAPEQADRYTMGDSILFQAVDRGRPVSYIKPAWAYTYTEHDLRYRPHLSRIEAIDDAGRVVAKGTSKALPNFSEVDSGYWWIELAAPNGDIIQDAEEIRDELFKSVYGVWDHLKNQGDHGAANYDLDWVGEVPGIRESRRLEGPYLLNENDVLANRVFPDAVAYGGWPMDMHTPGGLKDLDEVPSHVLHFDGIFTIPYRCYYSRNIGNLMMCGRDISVTKMAFGAIRVMATCAIGGQAVGTAAALAVRYQESPREVGEKHIRELQLELMRDDAWIPGIDTTDPDDLARDASVTATSETAGCEAASVVDGHLRKEGGQSHCWQSGPIGNGQAITLTFPVPRKIHQVRMVFDPDLSQEIMPSLTASVRSRQPEWLPPQLVRSYRLEVRGKGKLLFTREEKENHQRLVVVELDQMLVCDTLVLTVTGTYGMDAARLYEIMVY